MDTVLLASACVLTMLPISIASPDAIQQYQQEPLRPGGDGTGSSPLGSTSIQLSYTRQGIYTASVSLGSPPQSFLAAIDINWSDLFVPSVTCLDVDPEGCTFNPGVVPYNSSTSSTFRLDGRNVTLQHFGFTTKGNAAAEELHLGELVIRDQAFDEAYSARVAEWGFIFDLTYAMPLGLARETVHSAMSDLEVASPFQNLMEQNALDTNIFAFTLPRDTEETGMLSLGRSHFNADDPRAVVIPLERPPGRSSAPYHVPLTPSSEMDKEQVASGGWEVSAYNISATLGSTSTLAVDISQHRIIFSTFTAQTVIPVSFGLPFFNFVGINPANDVNCSLLTSGQLPNITISLRGEDGKPVDLVITPDDYIRANEPIGRGNRDSCQPGLILGPDHYDGEEQPFMMLGNILLRKYHSLFDADKKEITLLERSDHDVAGGTPASSAPIVGRVQGPYMALMLFFLAAWFLL